MASLASMYTEDGQLLPAGSEVVTGRGAIADFWQGVMSLGIASVRLETAELEVHDDTAIEIGKHTLLTDSGQAADNGKYLVVWKNQDGVWKLHRDIWTTSRPSGS